MSTFWLFIYFLPLLMIIVFRAHWWDVLLMAVVNTLFGWTIIGWFYALNLAGDMLRWRALEGPSGIGKLVVTAYGCWLRWKVRRETFKAD